jgi:hypothetical protein
MRGALLVTVLALGSCGPAATSTASPTTRPIASPSPIASASTSSAPNSSAFAVLEKDFLVEGGANSTISIIKPDGTIAASVSARKRSVPIQIGNISTSATRVYYLDGDSDLRYLSPDGKGGAVTRMKLAAHQAAVFAVSPDDRQIAVSILDFTRYPVGTRLYVENLDGSGHAELFSSTSVMEWPAGWHRGRLIMALGLNVPPQNAFEGFARGHGYHVVDAATGNRLLSICDGGDSYGVEVPAGTVCSHYPNVSLVTWDGDSRALGSDRNCTPSGPLAPNGSYMAARLCDGSGTVVLFDRNGTEKIMARRERPDGWLDSGHLVLRGDSAPYAHVVLNVEDGTVVPIAADGFFAAAVPGGL